METYLCDYVDSYINIKRMQQTRLINGGYEMNKVKKENPDRIGTVKFWAWQSRGASGAINFIILSFVSIYCTDTLQMEPALVGVLLMASKIVDAVTDLFAGYLVDRTNTRWGKGRPYEWAIVAAWFATFLLYSTPGGAEASLVMKCIWVFIMYVVINSICVTLLSACQNPYMIRAFGTDGQRVKLASFGGIVIMAASMAVNIIFPILMNRIATSAKGWSTLMLMTSVPLALIGILRFFFVKETIEVKDESEAEKVKISDVADVLKKNKYVYIVSFMYFVYSLVTGMGVGTYFFKYVVGNLELMGTASAVAIVALPLLVIFPTIMKKMSKGLLVQIGCIFYIVSGLLMFFCYENFTIILVGFVFTGVASLPITYLTDLMLIDCGTYNAEVTGKRMDGTIGAIKGFSGKVGSALAAGALGMLLSAGGYNGSLTTQPDSAILMIRFAQGMIPVIAFALVALAMMGYKLDKKQK